MQELTKAITAELAKMPEGTPVTAAALLHLADRAAVSRTFCALAKGGEILRVSRGVYVATTISRFGRQGPGVNLFIEQLANQSGEAIAPFGATCANGLGLTTQVPMHGVYWTSGRTRSYKMGKLTIYLQHVPDWQLVLWREAEGELVRALAWAGPAEAIKFSANSPKKFPRRRYGNFRSTQPSSLCGSKMPCKGWDSRRRRLWWRDAECVRFYEPADWPNEMRKEERETPSLSLLA